MTSAKVTIKQQDRSAIVAAMSGIEIGTVVNSKWGDINPVKVTSAHNLPDSHGKPDNTKGSSWNGAELLLAESNSVYITRAIHEDARYSASLVRFKITPVDYNEYPAAAAVPDLVVKPMAAGIALSGLGSYSFPLYDTSRVYFDMGFTTSLAQTGTKIQVPAFTDNDSLHTIVAGDFVSFGTTVSIASDIFEVEATSEEPVLEHVVTLSAAVTGDAGTEVKAWSGAVATSFVPPVYLVADASSEQIAVSNSDLIVNGTQITLDGGATNATVNSKDLVNVTKKYLVLTTPATVSFSGVHLRTQAEVEYRDAFLAVAKYPGDMGDRIKVGTRASVNYPDQAFFVDVYFDGVRVENFEVTRTPFIDGFGNQMYLEDVINTQSKYIQVKDNVAAEGGQVPLASDYSIWRKNPVDLFVSTGSTLTEDVLKGDEYVTLTDVTLVSIGARVKFTVNGQYEYKVLEKNAGTKTIRLDRPVLETKVNSGTVLAYFDSTQNNPSTGIFNGVQYSKFTKIDSVLTDKVIGESYVIGSNTGVVLSAGANNAAGGFDGSAITVADVVAAFQKMSNKEKYKISAFCDNGFSYPEVSIAINQICKNNYLAHGFGSIPFASERSSDPLAAVLAARNATNLNSEYISLFSGWVQVTDVYNQTKVWVAPSVFAVNAQSFVTRNYNTFSAAAGWVKGRLDGLDISVEWEEGDRDTLIAAQINPIRKREGYGLAIWGNETTYVKPSPLQLRSVAMLLIILKYGLENYLEFELFFDNNEETWSRAETAIDTFIRDTLFTPGGLYGYQVKVKDIITDTDIDNRKMPIFVGIQPTMDIKEIPVSLGIFNKSVAISF